MALPVLLDALGDAVVAATGLTAGVGLGEGISGMMSKPPPVTDPEAEREWQEYKDKYAEPPPSDSDKCEFLRWKLRREQALLAARQAWDAKWGPYHTEAIAQSKSAVRNAEDRLRKAGCSCP